MSRGPAYGERHTVHAKQLPEDEVLFCNNCKEDGMNIYEYLDKLGIPYVRHDHEPVYTCEQAERLNIPGGAARTKNLFLRDRKGRRHFLVTVSADKSVDIKALEVLLGVKGLSFASNERMMTYLGLTPGAVTILGILHDANNAVEVIVDNEVWKEEAMQCHPLVNTSTLVISMHELSRFIRATGHEITLVDVPERNG